jgi:hypothetical protein
MPLFAQNSSKLPPPKKGEINVFVEGGINVHRSLHARVFPPGYLNGEVIYSLFRIDQVESVFKGTLTGMMQRRTQERVRRVQNR